MTKQARAALSVAVAGATILVATSLSGAPASASQRPRAPMPTTHAGAPSAAPVRDSLIAGDDSASDLALAMQAVAQPDLVTGAAWPALGDAPNPSAAGAVGVGSGFVGRFMPDDGVAFAAMTTGAVSVADPPNDASGAGADNGASSRNVMDLSLLRVDVTIPSGDNCVAFDGVFYSEEYPEYVGSQFNDGFIAELDSNDWAYDTASNTVSAPHNFAFDQSGHQITVNSASFASSASTELQYDGSTELLTAAAPVSPGAHSIYLSIYDAGDHIYDSAVFLDNLRSYNAGQGQCAAGATLTDTDGDGISDNWETNGIRDHDGNVLVDLPAMGADPQHKDVFVQLDAMPHLALSFQALKIVEDAFNAAPRSNPDGTSGIHLHVDEGPNSVMNPVSGATWGALSRANLNVPFQGTLGSSVGPSYNWAAFDAIKAAGVGSSDPARLSVFHYALSVNRFNAAGNSGLSRGLPGSDLLVALGPWCKPEGSCPGTLYNQAGTFMHELGHNLGLHHGGLEDTNYVPNYISVMNYTFQMTGIAIAPHVMDYSRYDSSTIPLLDETNLSEPDGFGVSGGDPLAGQWTSVYCASTAKWTKIPSLSGPADLNCDGNASGSGLEVDLNHDGAITTLDSYNDWNLVKFKGGAIGGNGLGALLPGDTPVDEAPLVTLQELSNSLVPPPTATTRSATSITTKGAKLGGDVRPNGQSTSIYFEYGRTSAYGSQSAHVAVGSGSALLSKVVSIGGLARRAVYHYRLVAVSDQHLAYGADRTFTTPISDACVIPVVKRGASVATARALLRAGHCRIGDLYYGAAGYHPAPHGKHWAVTGFALETVTRVQRAIAGGVVRPSALTTVKRFRPVPHGKVEPRTALIAVVLGLFAN